MYRFSIVSLITLFILMIYLNKLDRDNKVLQLIRSRTLQTHEIQILRARRSEEDEELKGWDWLKDKWRKLGERLTLSQIPYDCNAILFDRINKKCCKLPELIPAEAFENCTIRNVSLSFRKRYNSYRRGPMCLYSCVFSDLNMLELPDEEDLDVLAITTTFSDAVDEKWRKLVRDSIVSCNEALNENVTASVLLTSFGQTCSVAPLLLMKCIKKTLMLSCPSTILKNEDADCPKDMERLRGCNPFFMMHQNSSSSRLLLKRPETTPITTPYRPPPRSRDNNMPSPWSRPPGPPNGGEVIWHKKPLDSNNNPELTTPMHSQHDDKLKTTENKLNIEVTTLTQSTTSHRQRQSTQPMNSKKYPKNKHTNNDNNKYGTTKHGQNNDRKNYKMTTQFDEWQGLTEEPKLTRDVEDTTLGAMFPRRDKYVPKINNS